MLSNDLTKRVIIERPDVRSYLSLISFLSLYQLEAKVNGLNQTVDRLVDIQAQTIRTICLCLLS